jgi:hypothetical protein
MDKKRKHDAGKPKLNRIKQMPMLARSITKENRIHPDEGQKKMPRNTRSARQTENFPTSNNFK